MTRMWEGKEEKSEDVTVTQKRKGDFSKKEYSTESHADE